MNDNSTSENCFENFLQKKVSGTIFLANLTKTENINTENYVQICKINSNSPKTKSSPGSPLLLERIPGKRIPAVAIYPSLKLADICSSNFFF